MKAIFNELIKNRIDRALRTLKDTGQQGIYKCLIYKSHLVIIEKGFSFPTIALLAGPNTKHDSVCFTRRTFNMLNIQLFAVALPRTTEL